MEAHYFRNDCFLTTGQLLANARTGCATSRHHRAGRYDLLCPPSDRSRGWRRRGQRPRFRIVENAGIRCTIPASATR